MALVLVLAAGGWANLMWSRRAPEVTYRVDFKAVPRQLGALQGTGVPVEQRIFEYLGADAMEELTYTDGRRRVDLALVYGTDWRAVHSPLSCLPQQGWRVDERRLVTLPAPPGCPHPGPLQGQLLRAHKPDGRQQLVLYVFAHRGGTSGDWVQQGWAVARTPRGTGGLMILLSMPLPRGNFEEAQATLEEVLGRVYLPAVGFWYQ